MFRNITQSGQGESNPRVRLVPVGLRRLADGLDELAARSGAGGSDLVGLAERVRLLAAAVEDEDGGVVINTRSAISDDVEVLFDPGAICGR